jgi:hypothetical protein
METSVQLDEDTKREIQREFVRILHNSHEHIEHLRHAYSDAVRGEAKTLLLQHIVHEEKRNLEEATELRERAAGYLDWEIKVLQDHSTFIRKVAEGQEIDPEAGLRLLHHFEEEHQELFNRFGDPEFQHESHESSEEGLQEPASPEPAVSESAEEPTAASPEPESRPKPAFTVGKPEA